MLNRLRFPEYSQATVRRLSQVAFWICVLSVAYLSFVPSSGPPSLSGDERQLGDHLFAFAVMAALADLGWPAREQARLRWGLLIGYGLLIESVQHFIPNRHFSVLDLSADGAGVLVYLTFKAAWQRCCAIA